MKADVFDQENPGRRILASKTEQKQQQQQQHDVIENKDGSNVTHDSDDNNKSDNSNNKIITFGNSDIKTYVTYRINNSNLKKYYLGKGLSIEEADEVVNSFALINALVLTIPFSILASYSNSFWDWLNENNDQCDGNSYQKVADLLLNTLYSTAYAAMTALIIAILYYILRPKDKDYFKTWYGHAKWAIFIMFCMTATGIIGMLTNFGAMAGWYASRSGDLCDHQLRNKSAYNTGIVVLVVFVSLSCAVLL